MAHTCVIYGIKWFLGPKSTGTRGDRQAEDLDQSFMKDMKWYLKLFPANARQVSLVLKPRLVTLLPCWVESMEHRSCLHNKTDITGMNNRNSNMDINHSINHSSNTCHNSLNHSLNHSRTNNHSSLNHSINHSRTTNNSSLNQSINHSRTTNYSSSINHSIKHSSTTNHSSFTNHSSSITSHSSSIIGMSVLTREEKGKENHRRNWILSRLREKSWKLRGRSLRWKENSWRWKENS
ncbi:uncharacterized protein [Diadema antillarum]|uniref:uncharacterized protein n=1 Tax=Diadema antillarum TaxID=105358 RepID=UPI003A89967F